MDTNKRGTLNNSNRFEKIVEDIKSIKIQGATNVARFALEAYFLNPSKKSKKILLKSRPTEPMMQRALDLAESKTKEEILEHFDSSKEKINQYALKLIKNKDRIFTHCHSSTVSNALIHAKKNGRKFRVYNTETRPLYQGRKTSRELTSAGIDTILFIDSSMANVLERTEKGDNIYATKIFLGADALTKKGAINKVGSYSISRLAHLNKISLYILADSWKYTPKKPLIEQRSFKEVWENPPKNVKIKNPAFEMIPKKYISRIVTELGVMGYEAFLKKCRG
ncbi:MAG: hypothetical protein KKC19_04195 [Nanoarchaeota archaeon]|nr:hypothetical protein [Nanoarchaeota archaeon]